jgi:quercetin dioxygenase-like cupin family protein
MQSKQTPIDNRELTRSQSHIIVEIIQYIPHAVLSRTIIKKTTGNITALSFDAGEELSERTSPFDNYVQIIDGTAEIFINEIRHLLKLGEGIIIPAHSRHCFNANVQFKMISTTIKSGYDN